MENLNNMSVGRLIKISNLLFETYINNNLKEMNLTNSQMNVLLCVYVMGKKNKDVNQVDIQNIFNLSNPTVSGILSRLEDKGFLVRENDGRKNRIKLTDNGIQLIRNGEEKIKLIEDKIVNCLSSDEKDILLNILRKIIVNNKMGVDFDDKRVS